MRMGCRQLNSDLHKIGVVESPSCSCGANIETSYHFFFQCNRYVLLRNELQCKIITLGNFNLKTLLFGTNGTTSQNEDIFKAVHKYIKYSGRFKIWTIQILGNFILLRCLSWHILSSTFQFLSNCGPVCFPTCVIVFWHFTVVLLYMYKWPLYRLVSQSANCFWNKICLNQLFQCQVLDWVNSFPRHALGATRPKRAEESCWPGQFFFLEPLIWD